MVTVEQGFTFAPQSEVSYEARLKHAEGWLKKSKRVRKVGGAFVAALGATVVAGATVKLGLAQEVVELVPHVQIDNDLRDKVQDVGLTVGISAAVLLPTATFVYYIGTKMTVSATRNRDILKNCAAIMERFNSVPVSAVEQRIIPIAGEHRTIFVNPQRANH